jgi:hypothetical protein
MNQRAYDCRPSLTNEGWGGRAAPDSPVARQIMAVGERIAAGAYVQRFLEGGTVA